MRTIFGRLALLLCLLTGPVWASQLTAHLTPQQSERYHALITELRCLVCQNQNIADSNAPLAEDLRQQVLEMIEQGKTDAQIKTYLVERYGDFVLYRPPLKPSTWVLWGSPFLLLIIGLLIAWRIVAARRSAESNSEVDATTLERSLHEDDSP